MLLCCCCCCWHCCCYCWCYCWWSCCCCYCWSQKPTIKVWLLLGQEQLRYCWCWVCYVELRCGWAVVELGLWQFGMYIWYIWLTFQLYFLLNDHPQSSYFHSGFPSIHLQSSYCQLGFSPIFNNIFGLKKLSFKLYYLLDLQLSILRINIIMNIHSLPSSGL